MASSRKSNYEVTPIQIASIETVTLVQFAAPLSAEMRRSLTACLVSTLVETPTSHLQAVELVLNILSIAIPEMGNTMGALDTLRINPVQLTDAEVREWMGMDDAPAADSTVRPIELPAYPSPLALGVTKVEAVYAAVASILYAIGKQASESAATAALDKRPDALVRRFDIGETDRLLLPGREAGPSRASLECIYNAFATYSEARATIIRFFLAVKKGMSHFPIHLEVMMTSFNLMRGAGMTHMEAVVRLARMHPWVVRFPELEPYFVKFVGELGKYQEIDEEVRPYHRLLCSQQEYLFVSADYRPLIAVAGSFISEVEKTFKNYVYNSAQYQDLIDKVHSYAPNYNPTSGLAKLTTMLGIPDVPLPPRAEGTAGEDERVV